MEASAVAAVCAYYDMECTVALLVSDKHPLREGDAPLEVGGARPSPSAGTSSWPSASPLPAAIPRPPIINKKEEAPSP